MVHILWVRWAGHVVRTRETPATFQPLTFNLHGRYAAGSSGSLVSWINVARDRAKQQQQQQHGNGRSVPVLTCLGGQTDRLLAQSTVIITGTCNRLISFPILALAKQTVSVINGHQALNCI